jgi:hypothetical protein
MSDPETVLFVAIVAIMVTLAVMVLHTRKLHICGESPFRDDRLAGVIGAGFERA